jgi:hypothetical protein
MRETEEEEKKRMRSGDRVVTIRQTLSPYSSIVAIGSTEMIVLNDRAGE